MKCCRFCVQTVPPLLDQEERYCYTIQQLLSLIVKVRLSDLMTFVSPLPSPPISSPLLHSGEPLSLTSVQVYSSEALSLLFQYSSSERQDVHFSAVAQLPLESLINLEMVTATADSVEADFEWYIITYIHHKPHEFCLNCNSNSIRSSTYNYYKFHLKKVFLLAVSVMTWVIC